MVVTTAWIQWTSPDSAKIATAPAGLAPPNRIVPQSRPLDDR
jgi:hypothetical protein